MKRLIIVICIVILIISCYSIAFAEPEDINNDEIVDIDNVDNSQDIIINDSVSGREVIKDLISVLEKNDNTNDDLILKDVTVRSLNPVTSADTSGLKSALLGVLGSYDAIVVEYQYQSSQGYYSYLREIQPDYVWLCSCAILLVVIYCLFRLGGNALSKR